MVGNSNEVDEIPRLKWPRRIPVPRDFGVSKGSCIAEGKSWPVPEGATRIATLRVERFSPDGDEGPQMDTIRVDFDDCGPMLLRCRQYSGYSGDYGDCGGQLERTNNC